MTPTSPTPARPRPVLAVHGGAGAIPRSELNPGEAQEIHRALQGALHRGYAVLASGGSALDAVTTTVLALEESPHFNAGYGAALNRAGIHELDAAVMDGATGRAGAVAGVQRVRRPVLAARALLEADGAVLLQGPSADAWAAAQGLETVDNDFFTTPARQDALRRMLEREQAGTAAEASQRDRHGTVGAVALDRGGHLAAATSTGGYTAKPPGRVGDSPLIGAGTWADDRTCAVSGTGKGELFIRTGLAHDLHSRMLYAGAALEEAAQAVVDAVTALEPQGGAGLCAVDRLGRVALPFDTEGMYRGWTDGQQLWTGIHADLQRGEPAP